MRKKYKAKKNVYVNKNYNIIIRDNKTMNVQKISRKWSYNKNKNMKCEKRSWTQPTRTRSKDKEKKAYHKSDMWEEEK